MIVSIVSKMLLNSLALHTSFAFIEKRMNKQCLASLKKYPFTPMKCL